MEDRLRKVERELGEVNAKLDNVASTQKEQGEKIDQAEKQLSIMVTKLGDLDQIKSILLQQGLSRGDPTNKEVKTEIQLGNVHATTTQTTSHDKTLNLSTPAKVGLGAAIITGVTALGAWISNYFNGIS